MKTVKLITLIIIATTIQFCSEETTIDEEPIAVQTTATEVSQKQPVSVAILDDRSGSRSEFGIPPFDSNMLMPFLDYIRESGGSLMMGIISTNSELIQPVYLRLPLHSPELPQMPTEPVRSDFNSDFSYRDAIVKYRQQLDQYNEKIAIIETEKIRMQEQKRTRIEDFVERVDTLTSKTFDHKVTDILNAINYTIPFHNTAIDGSRRITIILSDGIHNRQNSHLQEHNMDGIEYYLVPGSVGLDQEWVERTGTTLIPDFETLLQIIGIGHTVSDHQYEAGRHQDVEQ